MKSQLTAADERYLSSLAYYAHYSKKPIPNFVSFKVFEFGWEDLIDKWVACGGALSEMRELICKLSEQFTDDDDKFVKQCLDIFAEDGIITFSDLLPII